MAKYRLEWREDGSVQVGAKYHPRGGIARTFTSTGATAKDTKACMLWCQARVAEMRPKQETAVNTLQKLTGGT